MYACVLRVLRGGGVGGGGGGLMVAAHTKRIAHNQDETSSKPSRPPQPVAFQAQAQARVSTKVKRGLPIAAAHACETTAVFCADVAPGLCVVCGCVCVCVSCICVHVNVSYVVVCVCVSFVCVQMRGQAPVCGSTRRQSRHVSLMHTPGR